ncbi:MAG: MarR family winged helix-turn-helix transcriptional regulator, partial [Solirubrobacterales bacterium]
RDLEGARVQSTGFFVLVLLSTAGGELELRALRHRMQTSKANATEVIDRLVARGLVGRRRSEADRRTVLVSITPQGTELVDRRCPRHSERVREAFAALDDDEKRSLAQICRKLAA